MGEGNVFTGVCLFTGGLPCGVICMEGVCIKGADPSSEIRSTGSQYASNWNALLFGDVFTGFNEFGDKK